MIAYVCKYTPVEIIKAFGEDIFCIEPKVSSYENAEKLLHPNMCSFAKAIVESVLQDDIKSLVLTNCCDSIKRVYDVLKDRMEFIEIIDLPRENTPAAAQFFYYQLERFKSRLSKRLNEEFDEEVFISQVNKLIAQNKDNNFDIAIMGARAKKELVEFVCSTAGGRVLNLTCSGERFCQNDISFDGSLESYAKVLLNFPPCMRMNIKREFIEENSFKGIIYNTIKFCDFYSFEYAKIKEKSNVLKIETDFSQNANEQIRTRVEAFVEKTLQKGNIPKSMSNKRYFAGIDSGSTSTNAVVIDSSKNILGYCTVKTGFDVVSSAKAALSEACSMAGINEDDISFITSTGYGRISIPFSNLQVTEITCHAKGAHALFSSARTIIDIGGQDSKVIKIDEDGNVLDFVMNDKCSAGTGRFIEYMARVLELDLEDFSKCLNFSEDLTISSMCTVFAESEVISLIAQGKKREDIIRAINKVVAIKAISLVNRVKGEKDFVITGGVAKNKGVVLELEKRLGCKLLIPFDPQIVGALGAAIIGLEGS
ncbi:acyl-CoA dehydratase activase [Anaerocellum danielii]|uniref:Acyl-CoA dehydratase activase n=1 Tax=Anaerocellum danielii TaxID=1387557 RepID=A0ABZ0TZ02_9FIRM|nr:acyl-CoA dehydratase activase [Caldicellulosiruptor danielii]WPX08694.1 acyl-CoA dehydratase activase [Caldicellulosiruptor danielii]